MRHIAAYLLATLFFMNICSGQDTLYIYQSGKVVGKRAVTDIDSIIFYDAATHGNPQLLPRSYFGAGNFGDRITFEIDPRNMKYSFKNESTGAFDGGDFNPSADPLLPGIMEITCNGHVYPLIEMPGMFLSTAYPSGNANNTLVFAMVSSLRLSTDYSSAELAGKYAWVDYDDLKVFEWGGIEVRQDGSFTWQAGPGRETDFKDSLAFSGLGQGTWTYHPSQPSRMVFRAGQTNFEGTLYPGKALLMENGRGYGFTAGVSYPAEPVTQEACAGTYRYIEISADGYRSAGRLTWPGTGTMTTAYHKYYNHPVTNSITRTITGISGSVKVKNAFTASIGESGVISHVTFLVLPGEIILYFIQNGEGKIVSSGIGFREAG